MHVHTARCLLLPKKERRKDRQMRHLLEDLLLRPLHNT